MNQLLPWLLGLPAALFILHRLILRLRLSRAKHRSLAGHSRMAKRLARLVPGYEFGPERFFCADGADEEVAERRRRGFEGLAAGFLQRSPKSKAVLGRLAEGISDLRFVSRYRVPFPFSRVVREQLFNGVVVQSSHGQELTDIDGNVFVDLTGAYGVNVFGNDRYKLWIEQGSARVSALGPILGPYHPVIEGNVERLKAISGLDEVSFHMSGTEAVMQAVRLARFHTGRSHVVRFCGAYHGWWDDVQPGIGNPGAPGKVYTLAEMSDMALDVIRTRRDIACVLVNPLQALHPNRNAPGDGSLITGVRRAGVDREAYTEWLKALREACTKNGVVLIIDEIFVGFRIARGGAQEYFGVAADMVTYGKTLGGGLPIGVLCGRSDLMKRFRDTHPADICFARGTFNSHPCVMGTMSAFLDWFESGPAEDLYDDLDARWNARTERMNEALSQAGLAFRVASFSSIFTVTYSQPSRYSWMLQFYLNAEQLLLPWVGTGRFLFPIDFDGAMFDEVTARFVRAGQAMQRDGWWRQGTDSSPAIESRRIRRMLLGETAAALNPGGFAIRRRSGRRDRP